MPRNYTRKTRWGLTPIEEMKRAVSDAKGGKSIRSVAKERNIDRSTLQRYIKKSEEEEVKMTGYMGTAEANRIFPLELEKELADHIKKLAEQFHGLTQKKCRELASELAERNNISTPSNWTEKGLAGRMCKKQQHHGILYLDSDPLGSCLTTEISSEGSDVAIPFDDTSEHESSSDERSEPDVLDLVVGDFVIVKFVSKCIIHLYIGLVDSLEGNEVSARFLRRIRAITGNKKPTFAFKEKDEASFPRSDVLKRLPQLQTAGGTAGGIAGATVHFPLQP
uniref:Zgc:113274 n=1 Tax=Lates calcarifer TaxID=8187 RepID=A0A4W6C0P6_LATCA